MGRPEIMYNNIKHMCTNYLTVL